MQHVCPWVYQVLASDLKFVRQFEFLCFGYLCPLILIFFCATVPYLNRAGIVCFERVSKIYDQIIQAGLAFHESLGAIEAGKRKRRVGHNLLIRLSNFKKDVLRYLTTPGVPFTNNQAEQDIRMMKIKQKISGGFRTTDGAHHFATIRGFFSTARKQNKNILNAIAEQLA